MARGARKKEDNGNGRCNGGQLDIEVQLFLSAHKLRKNLEQSDYKHMFWVPKEEDWGAHRPRSFDQLKTAFG